MEDKPEWSENYFVNFVHIRYIKKIHRHGDNIVLVYGIELDFLNSAITFNDSQALQTLLEEESKKSSSVLEEYLKIMETYKIKGTVQTSHCTKPGEGILNVAADVKADYVVVGCRGRGKLRRTFLGSVSDYLMHHSTVPVLICPYKE
ncbi:hypothetical protein KUTeg_020497 [Tegillarca granosa]|uniref:UspA domain-containing protein n=1 Tax=Tegillarca granosa TaxID=220873 RepID=A0ABQ9EDC3_TEGGR|nr:hypothetical protein KUTeg_020497 [Tegillarca granosa]